jgi:hypothetical protein
MWIPEPLYEKIPHFWFLAGIMFISTGLYLGFEFPTTFVYAVLGVVCCLSGIGIFTLRVRYRANLGTDIGPSDLNQQD